MSSTKADIRFLHKQFVSPVEMLFQAGKERHESGFQFLSLGLSILCSILHKHFCSQTNNTGIRDTLSTSTLDNSVRTCYLHLHLRKENSWGLFSGPETRWQGLLKTAYTRAQFRSPLCSTMSLKL